MVRRAIAWLGSRTTRPTAVLAASAALCGCAAQVYEPQPLDPEQSAASFIQRDLDDPGLREFMREHGHSVEHWPLRRWDLDGLALAGVYLHPDLAVARAQVEVRRAATLTAARRPSTALEPSAEHHRETPGDVSPWTLGTLFHWTVEPADARRARVDRARALVRASELDALAKAWEVRSRVRRRFLELYDASMRVERLEGEVQAATEGVRLLERRAELGQASSFEVTAMRLRQQRVRVELSNERARAAEQRAGLASAVGVDASVFRDLALSYLGIERLPAAVTLPRLDLRATALLNRYAILEALQQYESAEAALREEIAGQHPNVTLKPGYFFDQDDSYWVFEAEWLLAMVNRNAGPIAEARARRELSAAQFNAVQARVIAEVDEAYVSYTAALVTLRLAEELVRNIDERDAKLRRQLELGLADRLTIVNSTLETIVARLALHDTMVRAQRSLGRLEDAVERPLLGSQPEEM